MGCMGCKNNNEKKKRFIDKNKIYVSIETDNNLKDENLENLQYKKSPKNEITDIKKIEENFIINEKFKKRKERKLSMTRLSNDKNFSKLEKLKTNSKSYMNPQMIYQKNFDNLNENKNQNTYIFHLLTNLYKKTNITENNYFTNKNEFIDWIQSKNAFNENIWVNNGKKVFTKEEIKNIYSLSLEQIKKENFLKRRIWISCYIKEVISEQIIDNSFLIINRNNILEDSLNQFKNNKEINLKRPLHIFFIDEDCNDIGGIYREYFSSIFKEFFSEKNNFFKELHNEGLGKNTIILSDTQPKYNNYLEYYELFGKLVAKALVDRFILNENLNRILLKHLMNIHINLEDMKYYDIELYDNFKQILNMNNLDDEEQFLFFVWYDTNYITNEIQTIELIPNGENIAIKNNNKEDYINKIIQYITYTKYKDKIDAIIKGFNSLIPNDKLNIFTIEEFDLFLSGQIKIDLNDWKNNTEYFGGYSSNSITIINFWKVLEELDQHELNIFFTFCTGCARPPINGFKTLQTSRNKIQKFSIEKLEVNNGKSLILARICFNRIYLPEFKDYESLKNCIKTIISNDTNYFGII